MHAAPDQHIRSARETGQKAGFKEAFASAAQAVGKAAAMARLAFSPFETGGRPMSAAEIDLAREYFSDEIDYGKVRIHRVRTRRIAYCTGNHLYFSDSLTENGGDYTKHENVQAEIRLRALFIHELTHAWQKQKHPSIVGKLKAAFSRAFGGDPYAYDLADNRDFLHYGIEQQAQLMQDFCRVREYKRLAGQGDRLVKLAGLDEHEHYPAMEKKIGPVFQIAPL
jgi:hypothetical protein